MQEVAITRGDLSALQGGVVGTLDASGNLIEKNARPTRVKRSIINHGAKELLHRAHSMEELMAEAAADGHRLQALVDSAHQVKRMALFPVLHSPPGPRRLCPP